MNEFTKFELDWFKGKIKGVVVTPTSKNKFLRRAKVSIPTARLVKE